MSPKQVSEAISRSGAAVVMTIVCMVASGVWFGASTFWATLDERLADQEERLNSTCTERIATVLEQTSEIRNAYEARLEEIKHLCGWAHEGTH